MRSQAFATEVLGSEQTWNALSASERAGLQRAYKSYGLDLDLLMRQARRKLVKDKVRPSRVASLSSRKDCRYLGKQMLLLLHIWTQVKDLIIQSSELTLSRKLGRCVPAPSNGRSRLY